MNSCTEVSKEGKKDAKLTQLGEQITKPVTKTYKSFSTKDEFEEEIANYIAENLEFIRDIVGKKPDIDLSEIEKTYGEIDREKILSNGEFMSLIEKGINPIMAYRAVFFEDLSKSSNQKGKEEILSSIRSKANRISEIGVIAKNAPMLKKDPSKMNDDEIEEIRKKVRTGEKVRF